MTKRLRLSAHVALTLVAFATTGRAPRLVTVGPRDLPTFETPFEGSETSTPEWLTASPPGTFEGAYR